MDRKEELQEICKNLDAEKRKLIAPLIDKMVFLEEKLDFLMTLPFLVVKEDNPTKQKVTPAYKQYKEFMQTYLNTLKIIYSALGIDGNDTTESPYRKWLESRTKRNE